MLLSSKLNDSGQGSLVQSGIPKTIQQPSPPKPWIIAQKPKHTQLHPSQGYSAKIPLFFTLVNLFPL